MLKFISAVFAATLLFSGVVSAQVVAGAGFLQGGTATSTSGVNGGGGSGAAFAGISGTQTTAASSNVSGAQVVQTPGNTLVITESVSTGGMQSTSGALGLAGAGSGSAFGADGTATGVGGQGGFVIFAP